MTRPKTDLDRARSGLYRDSLQALEREGVSVKSHQGATHAAWDMGLKRGWWKRRLREPWRRYRLLEFGLLAVTSGRHVVIADHPVERSREARDAIIDALASMGFESEARERLHAWPPNALWFAWATIQGIEPPSLRRYSRAKLRKVERARERTLAEIEAGDLSWLREAFVFKLPIEPALKKPEPPKPKRRGGKRGRGRRQQPAMPDVIVVRR